MGRLRFERSLRLISLWAAAFPGFLLVACAPSGDQEEGFSQPNSVAQANAPSAETTEVSPPDILDLVQVGEIDPSGRVQLEAVVKPGIEGEVELQVISPEGLRFDSGVRSKRLTLARGTPENRERLTVDLSSGEPRTVRIRLLVYNDEGNVWLSMDKELRFYQTQADPSLERVPVVQELPDGTRVVEYMTREQARQRGLTPAQPEEP